MAFAFHDRGDGRESAMLKAGLIVGALAMSGAAQAQQQPGEALAQLTGSCWRTLFDGKGPDTDTHCFEAAVGGKMVTDTHKVRNGEGKVVYEGVSVYLLDSASGELVYEYFNSMGGKLVGYGRRVGDEIHFGAKPGQDTPDLVWKLGADGYDVIPAGADKGHVGRFVRVAPGK
jgi:hypothetical protein